MTDDRLSRIKVSLHDGIIEIEGSESFVGAQVKRFENVIAQFFSGKDGDVPAPRVVTPPGKAHKKKEPSSSTGTGQLAQFEEVFTVTDGIVQIHKPIPGDSMKEKMVAVAKLVVLALTLSGTKDVPSATVRAVCESHGCLDSPNFARTMKAQRSLFVLTGKGQKLMLQLSVPGKRAVEQFAKSLSEAD